MPRMIRTRSGKLIEMPSAVENEVITQAALSDDDNPPYSDKEWETVKPALRRGRPTAAVTKERITIRLSRDVVQRFRASGDGWQTRVDAALKEWLKTHTTA